MQEYLRSTNAYFVTFTYDDNSAPKTLKNFMSLSKKDFQLYMRRLRHDAGKGLKYYVCGEYGPLTYRPHYHAIIFNCDLKYIIGETAKQAELHPEYYLDGRFQFNEDNWKNGHITVGLVTGASIGYTLKYISKPRRVPMWNGDDRVPEFSLMSKGLGSNYLTPSKIQYHKQDPNNRLYCQIDGGKKIAMPRYYKTKIFQPHELQNIGEYFQNKAYDEMAQLTKEQRENFLLQFSKKRLNIEELNRRGKKSTTKYVL